MKMKNKTEKILIAGFGGQGVMMIGQMLAFGAIKENMNSLWHPSYGPETRGGTANCSVIISSEVINSPIFKKPDVLIALNKPSLDKFINNVNEDGIIIYNSSLITEKINTNKTLLAIPINDLAQELGNARVANMVMLGAYLGLRNLFDDSTINITLKEYLGKEKEALLDINLQAIALGKKYITEFDN